MEKSNPAQHPEAPTPTTRDSNPPRVTEQQEVPLEVRFTFTYPSSIGKVRVAVHAWRTHNGGTSFQIPNMEFCDRTGGESLPEREMRKIDAAAQKEAEMRLREAEAARKRYLEEARENARRRGDYDADDEVPPDHRGGDNDGFPLRER